MLPQIALECVVFVDVTILALLKQISKLLSNDSLVKALIVDNPRIAIRVLTELLRTRILRVVFITFIEDFPVEYELLLSSQNSQHSRPARFYPPNKLVKVMQGNFERFGEDPNGSVVPRPDGLQPASVFARGNRPIRIGV